MTKEDIDKCIDELDKEYNDKMEKLLTMKQETKEVTDPVKWTPEQVKAHRREVFEALLDRKKCEWQGPCRLEDLSSVVAAFWLFSNEPWRVRVKPEVKEPRKCWVGWDDFGNGLVRWTSEKPSETFVKWQLVTEDVKAQ